MKNKKTLALILSLVLVIGIAAGATVAWFTDTTDEVVNTFTVGNIDITLEESDTQLDKDADKNTNDYKMIPGHYVIKDPVATVKADSEDCYLFVKLEKSSNFDTFMEYEMAAGWTALDAEDYPGVYVREVAKSAADQPFPVIKDNKVMIKSSVTKEMMDALDKREKYPTLTVTAYAVQKYRTNNTPFGEVAAWEVLFPPVTP